MNINNLRNFAQDARRKLIQQVGAKLEFVLTTDSAELREKSEQLKQLRVEMSKTTKDQLIEKVAYTWFNRIMALRYLDVNDYQPLGIRIITPKEGYSTPEILDEAKRGNIPNDLKLNRQRIFDLLDNRISSSNPQNEAFKILLIAACNHLNLTFPFLFEKINDYTELLVPDDMTSNLSVIKDVRDGMPIVDCNNIEIIGWLYQYYISERKDQVFESKSKVKKEDIPAATQLFTPKWIVEYLVQNSLGKLWLQNRPNSTLKEHMPYYLESDLFDSDEYLIIDTPEDLKFLDPSCGSGHILVYAFDLLTKIYEEEGYNSNEIPQLILKNNLFGFEIDERAAQLSGIALMMKAREYHRRVFRKNLTPNILCYKDLSITEVEIKELLSSLQLIISEELLRDLLTMKEATNYGSLILPESKQSEITNTIDAIQHYLPNLDAFQRTSAYTIGDTLNQLKMLSSNFHCVVTNPPYMGSGKMNSKLSDFVKKNYPDEKADLMVCFMSRALQQIPKFGLLGMINLPSWMFISSFESFRNKLIDTSKIESLLHLGRGIFGSDFGTVSFTIKNSSNNKTSIGVYRRLFNKHVQVRSIEQIRNLFLDDTFGLFKTNQYDFKKIPSSPIAYWASERLFQIFSDYKNLESVSPVRQGFQTGNNDFFVRHWTELNFNSLEVNATSHQDLIQKGRKWVPYNKGGDFRRWFGNLEWVVAFDSINYDRLANSGNCLPSRHLYFQDGITWSDVTSAIFSGRYLPNGSTFSSTGAVTFPNDPDKTPYYLALLNSVVSSYILDITSPTLHFTVGIIRKIPVIEKNIEEIASIAHDCIRISQEDWNTIETNWYFNKNELLRIKGDDDLDLEETVDSYIQYWSTKFNMLHKHEEDINKLFIENYGLENQLEYNVSLKDVTIQQTIVRYTNNKLTFNIKEIIFQLISYAVGCMFGRYSLNKNGIIIGSKEDTLNNISENDRTFNNLYPDDDNIITFLEDEWFEDDIVGLFSQFIKVAFGEKDFNRNISFIEDQIGKDIRRFFIQDFYKYHIKLYKKRPIYWMFSSPNETFNVLVYLHRYKADTISDILNKYLKEFIGKLNTRKEHLKIVQLEGLGSERNKALKENDKIDKILIELQEYEREVLYPLAIERINIDLDDGVLVNFNKFGKAVREVQGLNDPKTKAKVKEFNWIDSTQIR